MFSKEIYQKKICSVIGNSRGDPFKFPAIGNSRGDLFKIPPLPPAKRPPTRLKKIEPIRTVSTVGNNSTISVSSHTPDDDAISIAA